MRICLESRQAEAEWNKTERKKADDMCALPSIVFLFVTAGSVVFNVLYSSRRQSNEKNAVLALKSYHSAQMRFRTANFGGRFGYAGDYSQLYYGVDGAALLKLIAKEFADARAFADNQGYEGYVFMEDENLNGDDWLHNFGLVAMPYSPGRTGRNIYWIGTEGVVYYRPARVQENKRHDAINTPLSPVEKQNDMERWHKFREQLP